MSLKEQVRQSLKKSYTDIDFDVLVPPKLELGDYSINLAFALAKKVGKNPTQVAGDILDSVQKALPDGLVARLAGPYINLFFSRDFLLNSVSQIIDMGPAYGSSPQAGKKINLEFISANPTGPVTVANARAGSYGDALGNILSKAGYGVAKEYYINDVGNQVLKLAQSVVNAWLADQGQPARYPAEDLYRGDYIADLASKVSHSINLPMDQVELESIQSEAIKINIEKAKYSVAGLGINFDEWFRESSLHDSGEVSETMELLKQKGATFEKDGATWLRYGPGEDNIAVLVKKDGATTYLMNDLAYTRNKLQERGFDKAINIWGADHHGDVPRLKGGSTILGFGTERLEIFLHQLVTLRKNGELVRMSKRAGNIETLDDLLNEVGKDAVRYFFLAKDLSTHMEFDIDLAKEQSKKNPVYYIQYAGARLASIFEKTGRNFDRSSIERIKENEELNLLRLTAKFPDIVSEIASAYHVHHLAQYAYELATAFHKFYESHRIVQDDLELQSARIGLCLAVREVLAQCLNLMGIEMKERM